MKTKNIVSTMIKNLLFVLASLVVMNAGATVGVTAGVSNPHDFFSKKAEVQLPQLKLNRPHVEDGAKKEEVADVNSNKGHMNVRAQKAPRYQERLDSIVSNLTTGQRASKFIYSYDENDYPTKEVRYGFSSGINQYVQTSETVYIWNADGYLLESRKIDPSEGSSRSIYDLGAGNLIDRVTNYIRVEDDWVPSSRTAFVYNAYGDVTEEINYSYVSTYGQWKETEHFIGEYDSKGRLNVYKEYIADDYYQMMPTIITYEYYGNTTLVKTETQPEAVSYPENIVNTTQRVYEYNSDDKLVKQYFNKWNATRENWDGGEPIGNGKYPDFNVIITYTYDDKGELTNRYIETQREIDGQFEGVQEFTYETTPDDADGSIFTYTQYSIRNGEKFADLQQVNYYNSWGGTYRRIESYNYGMGLSPQSETAVEFFDDHTVKEMSAYRFDYFGNRANQNRSVWERAANGDYTRIEDFVGDYSDPEAWVPYQMITKTLTDDFELLDYSVYKYDKSKGEYVFNSGVGFTYDFDILASSLLTWFDYNSGAFKYKITGMYEVVADARADGVAYYSKYGESGVQMVGSAELEGICEVYNINGVCVAKVEAGELDSISLDKGVYVVRCGNKVKKICK